MVAAAFIYMSIGSVWLIPTIILFIILLGPLIYSLNFQLKNLKQIVLNSDIVTIQVISGKKSYFDLNQVPYIHINKTIYTTSSMKIPMVIEEIERMKGVNIYDYKEKNHLIISKKKWNDIIDELEKEKNMK